MELESTPTLVLERNASFSRPVTAFLTTFGAKIAVFRLMGAKDQETVRSIVADMIVGRGNLEGSGQIEKE